MSGVAVVTIAHGRHDHLDAQHRALARGSRQPDHHVVVAMDDRGIRARTEEGLSRTVVHTGRAADGRLPLAAARNLGVRVALDAGAQVVVLLDVDCLPGSALVKAYAAAVRSEPGTVWSGPVTYLPPPPAAGYPDHPADLAAWDDPHPARPRPATGEVVRDLHPDLFWSLSFAVAAPTWRRVGGFCEDYTGYGAEDTDLGRTLAAAGVALGVLGTARAYHQHHPVSSPPVEHVDDILRNGRRFRDRWGTWPMTGWLDELEQMGLVRQDGQDWVRTHQEETA
ncbi:glycosyltransferase family 2 protein [Nocardioides sp. J2M5]|uniref:glycosyltransferase family 2 protein n=1 Tax=Nocardioides palaemonis TaxID=2829810 RepID=UPI001BA673A1|nr:galactosyltransferase-related protein [Nocardioides palaemonis]MBS2939769.1 glycosyltransferase family 2 protein [Nocardioides palaemonis]